MSLYLTIREMHKVLGQFNVWFDKATAHATAKKFDPETMLHWRIAPDMFPLSRQIQTTCDQAKFAAARAAGKEVPSHPDTEKTLGELRARRDGDDVRRYVQVRRLRRRGRSDGYHAALGR